MGAEKTNITSSGRTLSTVAGMFAIIFWSMTVPFSRSISESLGPMGAGAAVNFAGGVIAALFLIARPARLAEMLRLPKLYLLGCGSLFILYAICLFTSMGLASGRQQVIELGIINYLWPSFTLLFAVLILRCKAGILLPVGIILALSGGVLSVVGNSGYSWEILRNSLTTNRVPYLLAFACAIIWALYSTLSKKWGGVTSIGATPLFLIATGIIMVAINLFSSRLPHWSASVGLEVVLAGIFPTLVAFIFWDWAMRKGRMILVASLAYFIPLLSTFASSVYLHVSVSSGVWAACVLIAVGAGLCNLSIRDRYTQCSSKSLSG